VLIIFGPPDSASSIINDVRDRAAAGHMFTDRDVSDDLLTEGYRACFWQFPYDVYRD
jgi:hypothetical protein